VPGRLDNEQEVILPDVSGWEPFLLFDEEPITSTGETYLHLRAVDLDDREAIERFVARFGPLGGQAAAMRLSAGSGGDPIGPGYVMGSSYGRPDDRREDNRKRRALRAAIMQEHPRVVQRGGRTWKEFLDVQVAWSPSVVETLTEFRYAAACLHDLTDAWLALRNGNDPSELPWRSLADRSHVAMNAYNATGHLMWALERLLEDFSPRLEVEMEFSPPIDEPNLEEPLGPEDSIEVETLFPEPIDESDLDELYGPADSMEVSGVRQPLEAPLYAICALELFNHIVENADYWICANERCSRTFVRQEGRSQKGQHRSRGVRYCSAGCARAAAQRAYRRRKRTEGRGTDPH
jgi:hypothetical protein